MLTFWDPHSNDDLKFLDCEYYANILGLSKMLSRNLDLAVETLEYYADPSVVEPIHRDLVPGTVILDEPIDPLGTHHYVVKIIPEQNYRYVSQVELPRFYFPWRCGLKFSSIEEFVSTDDLNNYISCCSELLQSRLKIVPDKWERLLVNVKESIILLYPMVNGSYLYLSEVQRRFLRVNIFAFSLAGSFIGHRRDSDGPLLKLRPSMRYGVMETHRTAELNLYDSTNSQKFSSDKIRSEENRIYRQLQFDYLNGVQVVNDLDQKVVNQVVQDLSPAIIEVEPQVYQSYVFDLRDQIRHFLLYGNYYYIVTGEFMDFDRNTLRSIVESARKKAGVDDVILNSDHTVGVSWKKLSDLDNFIKILQDMIAEKNSS